MKKLLFILSVLLLSFNLRTQGSWTQLYNSSYSIPNTTLINGVYDKLRDRIYVFSSNRYYVFDLNTFVWSNGAPFTGNLTKVSVPLHDISTDELVIANINFNNSPPTMRVQTKDPTNNVTPWTVTDLGNPASSTNFFISTNSAFELAERDTSGYILQAICADNFIERIRKIAIDSPGGTFLPTDYLSVNNGGTACYRIDPLGVPTFLFGLRDISKLKRISGEDYLKDIQISSLTYPVSGQPYFLVHLWDAETSCNNTPINIAPQGIFTDPNLIVAGASDSSICLERIPGGRNQQQEEFFITYDNNNEVWFGRAIATKDIVNNTYNITWDFTNEAVLVPGGPGINPTGIVHTAQSKFIPILAEGRVFIVEQFNSTIRTVYEYAIEPRALVYESTSHCIPGLGTVPMTSSNTPSLGTSNFTLNWNSGSAVNGVVFQTFGDNSPNSFLGLSLPAELTSVGYPGCIAESNMESTVSFFAVSSSSPTGSLVLPIPNTTSLLGAAIYHQWIASDSSYTTPNNLALGNCVSFTIGF